MSSSSSPNSDSDSLQRLLGLSPSSPELAAHLTALRTKSGDLSTSTSPEVKSYPDAIYFNYFSLGLSLLFKPVDGYKPTTGLKREELDDADLVLDEIDIYNVPKSSANTNTSTSAKPSNKSKPTYATYPLTSLTLPLASSPSSESTPRPTHFTITPETTGKDFVQSMGEPDRKGGGAGPSSGSIGIWCEWSKDGLMVEFGGDESRGPQAWERGKDAVWKALSIFPPKA